MSSIAQKYNFSWQQTMFRIKDPKVSIPFYEKHFGMKLIHFYHFNDAKFSVFFLQIPKNEISLPSPGTAEAEKYLWNMKGTCLELTHNHGSENDSSFCVNNGNEEPYRGFGHIAFNCDDVEKATKELEQEGVSFYKKPWEGRMKTIAFVRDPDGYKIELCSRKTTEKTEKKTEKKTETNTETNKEIYNLSQTMLRVKDPNISLSFYKNVLGLKLIYTRKYDDFSVFFLTYPQPDEGDIPTDPESDEARAYVKHSFSVFLELTYNHGTEKEKEFKYHNGNDPPQGYGHIGLLCDDLNKTCEDIQTQHPDVVFKKKPDEGRMRGIAFLLDPDGYSIELIQRGITF